MRRRPGDADPYESWYVPAGREEERYLPPPGGFPPLHLIPHDMGTETLLRLCEDSSGLLLRASDPRLLPAGIYSVKVRGVAHHQEAACEGDFSPGAPVRLVPEPTNPYDSYAVAVYADDGEEPAGYYNRQKAKTLSRLLREGVPLRGISCRGTLPGVPCTGITVLAAAPAVVEHLLSPRPSALPPPAHLKA